ncbi:MAG TPA: GspE/PulE family protein, partial [Candidatus Saccharimonadales bacterium]|nr:GspE/PulE family protein [Candidatus Saccharimonadales bacterium]
DKVTEKLLLGGAKLDQAKLESLKKTSSKNKASLQETALKNDVISDKDLTELYGQEISVPFITIDAKNLKKETAAALPERIARQYNAVVFQVDKDGTHHIALSDPDDVQAVDFIKKYIGDNFKTYIATSDNILNALDAYRGGVASELDKVIEVQEEKDPLEETVAEEDVAEDSPIAQTVNLLLEYAIRSDASDIHIEPRDDHISVRYRIDGVLQEANKLPKNVHAALVSRIKILSNLKIDERRVPQDGRFKITLGSRQYAFRVSTLPITTGEKIVMRILDEGTRALTLEELGYWGKAKASIKEAIVQPHGMILVTGPTGSGKSTSLFSVLSMLNDPGVNISTVEDPVEYKIPGANQTQVNPTAGMTFIAGLRALLRQDPNIIMVGEIRDGETADLGVQAALTGHLVFSTLHTNNAATCLPRLLDMGIEPFLIASTVRAVVGQRLVRRLCSKCKEAYAPEKTEVDQITRLFGLGNDAKLKTVHELEAQAADEKIGEDIGKDLGSTTNSIVKLWRPKKGGCDNCHGTGFKGRMGIYEVLANTLEVQKLITASATSNAIQDQAIKEGMVTMQMDGLIKALRGLTSIEEILRATRE